MRKHALALAIPLLLLVALGASLARAEGIDSAAIEPSAEGESVSIHFAPLEQEVAPSDYVTMTVEIANAEDLFAVEVRIRFDPQIVIVDDAQHAKSGIQILPGPFMQAPYEAENSADNAAGLIDFDFLVDFTVGAQPVSGSGTLAIITFQSIGFGTTAISFETVVVHKQIAGSSSPPFKPGIGGDAEITVVPSYVSSVYLPVALRNYP